MISMGSKLCYLLVNFVDFGESTFGIIHFVSLEEIKKQSR